MRKIILFIASSLDGYIAGKNGEIDCLFSEVNYCFPRIFLEYLRSMRSKNLKIAYFN